ncbi:MAG: YihY/virulence factor BrkB family protein [Chitinophagales bacterium]|nr:YihY/virulence factor BrkB family protein [Chitinophagales bacterium]
MIKGTFHKFSEEDTMNHAAALAYYTIFSLPPILIIVIHTAGLFYAENSVREDIVKEVGELVGQDGARQLEATIHDVGILKQSFWSASLGLITLFFTATTVFITIQNTLNSIFRVKPKPRKGYIKLIRDRALSFAMILGVAFILLVSLILEALIRYFSGLIERAFPRLDILVALTTSFLLPFVITTLLFAMIFKWLPDVKIRWKDTLVGAFVTALLFSVGKLLIGYYVGSSNVATIYDAAGSVLVILVWVFYTSVIFFFGAQFTYVYARFYGKHIRPASYAVRIVQKEMEVDTEE